MSAHVTEKNLLKKEDKLQTYKIGVVMACSAIENQLILLIKDLNEYSIIDCVGVVLDEEYKDNRKWYDYNCLSIPIVCYRLNKNELLGSLDVIILPESNLSIYDWVPSSIVKIGLPHATDIRIESTLFSYGGGFCFDYILSATKQPVLEEHKYKSSFPKAMRLHQQPYTCILPFGSPEVR